MKCPKIENTSLDDRMTVYDSLFYETQSAKLNPHPDLITGIKEELIEFNKEKGIVTRYCVIQEMAIKTLTDIKKVWLHKQLSMKYHEYYGPEKLAFYIF